MWHDDMTVRGEEEKEERQLVFLGKIIGGILKNLSK
jgi:hypothetical protein